MNNDIKNFNTNEVSNEVIESLNNGIAVRKFNRDNSTIEAGYVCELKGVNLRKDALLNPFTGANKDKPSVTRRTSEGYPIEVKKSEYDDLERKLGEGEELTKKEQRIKEACSSSWYEFTTNRGSISFTSITSFSGVNDVADVAWDTIMNMDLTDYKSDDQNKKSKALEEIKKILVGGFTTTALDATELVNKHCKSSGSDRILGKTATCLGSGTVKNGNFTKPVKYWVIK